MLQPSVTGGVPRLTLFKLCDETLFCATTLILLRFFARTVFIVLLFVLDNYFNFPENYCRCCNQSRDRATMMVAALKISRAYILPGKEEAIKRANQTRLLAKLF